MSDVLLSAATRLADLLAQENAALVALDLPRAAALLAQKQAAAERFAAARSAIVPSRSALSRSAPTDLAPTGSVSIHPAPTGPVPAGSVQAALARLRDVGEQNRRLLERGIAIQGDVIGLIADALHKSGDPSRYAATGAPDRRVQPVAFALSARA